MNPDQPKLEKLYQSRMEDEQLMLQEKQVQWKNKMAQMLQPDNYGYVIDEGVRDTVVALRLSGINTIQSDQGNYNYTPFIEIGADEPVDIYVGEAARKSELLVERGIRPDEIDPHSPSFDRAKQVNITEDVRGEFVKNGATYMPAFEVARKETLQQAKKLQILIDEFYTTEGVSERSSLERVIVEFPYTTTIHTAYPYITHIPHVVVDTPLKAKVGDMTPDELENLHRRCQGEMQRFTRFLKERFFHDGS